MTMRVLVLSNFYPPYFIGGYELGCHEAVEALRSRGHEVTILTGTHGVASPRCEGDVRRWLELEPGRYCAERFPRYFAGFVRRESRNQRRFRHACAEVRPHVVYVWNLFRLSPSLCATAQRMGLPVSYFVFDNWLADFGSDPRFSLLRYQPGRGYARACWRVARALLARREWLIEPTQLDLDHVQFASEYLKARALRAGRPVAGAEVVHWGVDGNRYAYRTARPGASRLLYVGQLAPHKGVHTVIEALNIVVREEGLDAARLTVVGGATVPEYETRLRESVTRLGLGSKVVFQPMMPREVVANVYRDHDLLLFPSEWEEPFGITLLEAMATGIPVVSTATGGAAEIVRNDVNARVFAPGDARGCASAIAEVLRDPERSDRLRAEARRIIEREFRLDRTMDRIERALCAAVARSARAGGRVGTAAA